MDYPKELKKILENRKALSTEEAMKTVEEYMVTHPEYCKKIGEMQTARGAIIDMAIAVEEIYKQVILLTNSRNKLYVSFQDKSNFVKEVMEDLDKEKKHFSKELFEMMDKLVSIRNLFAHVPLDYTLTEMRFAREEDNYTTKTKKFKDKSVKELSKEFLIVSTKVRSAFDKILEFLAERINKQPLGKKV